MGKNFEAKNFYMGKKFLRLKIFYMGKNFLRLKFFTWVILFSFRFFFLRSKSSVFNLTKGLGNILGDFSHQHLVTLLFVGKRSRIQCYT
jgi:hypothetical protein